MLTLQLKLNDAQLDAVRGVAIAVAIVVCLLLLLLLLPPRYHSRIHSITVAFIHACTPAAKRPGGKGRTRTAVGAVEDQRTARQVHARRERPQRAAG